MPQTIRLGDKSSHGGTMISAGAPTVLTNGIATCVDQDQHACPISGHGVTPVSATGKASAGGKKIIVVGDQAGCGATLISGSSNVITGG